MFRNHANKIAIVAVLSLAFLVQSGQAYAYWGRAGWGGGYGGWHGGYRWHGGYGWGWGWPLAAGVALGATATAVWIAGQQYYYYDGQYYDYTPTGYVVVNPPAATVVATAPAATVADSTAYAVTVNVPNNSGGYTAVVLKRSGTGFVGPQGEFYATFPRVSQLRIMYGK